MVTLIHKEKVMETAISADQLAQDLRHFTGSMDLYKQPDFLGGMLYTEGVQHFCEKAGAYWFLDIISTEIHSLWGGHPDERLYDAFITLTVADNQAYITATDGDDNVYYTRKLEYTDAPEGDWKFWYMNDTLLLPSEY
jgi:hypothetical protein